MRADHRANPRTFAVRVLATLCAFVLAVVLRLELRVDGPVEAIACAFVAALFAVPFFASLDRRLERELRVAPYPGLRGLVRSLNERLLYSLSHYLSIRKIDRGVAGVQRLASAARRDVLSDVISQINQRRQAMIRRFPDATEELSGRAANLAVTVFEDDSDPSASLVVMKVFRQLGFEVNTAIEDAGFYDFRGADPRPIWHFRRVRTDYLLVGPKIAEDAARQFIQEVHTWEVPPTLHVNSVLENSGLLEQVFEVPLQDLPSEFKSLVVSQLWICLKFWQAQGEQRHRFSQSGDPQSLRSHSKNP
jgi:hypothetical protein